MIVRVGAGRRLPHAALMPFAAVVRAPNLVGVEPRNIGIDARPKEEYATRRAACHARERPRKGEFQERTRQTSPSVMAGSDAV